ncbi:hypothetical protein BDF19DRAFT_423677 [Syncephalis fuscata]|nr:hypothetical protein BDF19DRAFT_423677 [Syncephalis fuscata]
MLSDRFFVVLDSFVVPSEFQVYALGDYKLRESNSNSRLLVWDLENNQHYMQELDGHWDTSCIHSATCDYTTVYTVKITDEDHGVVEWALYQFSHNRPNRKLKQVYIG